MPTNRGKAATTARRGLYALLVAAPLALAVGCGDDESPSGSGGSKPPQVVKTDWGTFRLDERIADKVDSKEPIKYVFSYAGAGTPLFSDQYNLGYEQGVEAAEEIYPLEASKVAPVQPDANQQLSAIRTKLTAGQIDCLSLAPGSATAFNSLIDQMMDEGIPVFTVGVPTAAHEFTNFTQVPSKEGAQAAETVLDWMEANGKDFKTFAVSTGDPTQEYSVGRIDSFVNTIKEAIPDARFVTSQDNPLNMGYDPAAAYDKVKAFLAAHPDVQVLENVDIGAESADRAIEDLGRVGRTYTIGWNLTKGQLTAIEKGVQIAMMDQRWTEQAAFGAKACAEFLASGRILPNTQALKPYTKQNVDEARAALAEIGQ
jgi:ribose transport system substrate-binding protein